jgi:hypothetical protein
MSHKNLEKSLLSVDWNDNVSEFLKDSTASQTLADCNMRLAIWSKQFEIIDSGNPAISFIREMQIAGHHVAALTSLSLYKPAAGSMRTVLETALYYTYFRSHPVELATLVRDSKYYVQKKDVLDYHITHTPNFLEIQNRFGLIVKLGAWYNQVSAIIHGQIPGKLVSHRSLGNLKHVKTIIDLVLKYFSEGEEIVHHLFLCTAGRELWSDFASDAKSKLTAGINPEIKSALGIDEA